jgi:hypothetical protein
MSELVRLAKEALRRQHTLDPIPTVPPGAHITWTRGDLTVLHGMVDFVHVDVDGIAWAFVTLGESWAVVNVKFTARFEDLEP